MAKQHLYLKQFIRDILPKKIQVPLKYYYDYILLRNEKEMSLLKFLIERNRIAIDIGANRGKYSYILWKLGAEVKIIEPNPECLNILKVWAQNKRNIKIYPVALSDDNGKAILNIPIDFKGIKHDSSASISQKKNLDSQNINVATKTLDSFNFANVSFIKIDVEGHENEIIQGSKNTIKNSKPALIIEIEKRHLRNKTVIDIINYITSMDYECFFFIGQLLYPISSFDAKIHQNIDYRLKTKNIYVNNFVFLHKSKIELDNYSAILKKFIHR